MLPAVFSGVIWVLAPLRLDELGAGATTVGAVFLVSALIEGAASPPSGASPTGAGASGRSGSASWRPRS